MPFSTEQAKQIDWSVLIARLLELRSPLKHVVALHVDGVLDLTDETVSTLNDALTALDGIEQVVKASEGGSDDATTT